MAQSLDLSFRTELVPLDDRDHLVSVDVGANGNLLALWSTRSGARALTAPDPVRHPNPQSGGGAPVPALVVEYDQDVRAVMSIPEFWFAFPSVQQLSDGSVLVVGARSGWRAAPELPERNAAIYTPDGELQRTGLVGDGVEHVQVASDGRIWVGYFDEGVLGNNGWGGPGAKPIGAPGVICFDPEFAATWEAGERGLIDCYAMNVARDAVWISYYPGFPIVRIAGGRATRWASEITGVRAILVSGGTIALVGGYGGRSDRVARGHLDGERFQVERVERLLLPDGTPPDQAFLAGRGDTLHLVQRNLWYTARLEG